MLAVKTTRKSAVALPKELAVRPSQDDKPTLPHRKHHHSYAKPDSKPSFNQQLSIHKSQPEYQNIRKQRKTTASQDGERTGNPTTSLAAIHDRCCQNREARQGVKHNTQQRYKATIQDTMRYCDTISQPPAVFIHTTVLHIKDNKKTALLLELRKKKGIMNYENNSKWNEISDTRRRSKR